MANKIRNDFQRALDAAGIRSEDLDGWANLFQDAGGPATPDRGGRAVRGQRRVSRSNDSEQAVAQLVADIEAKQAQIEKLRADGVSEFTLRPMELGIAEDVRLLQSLQGPQIDDVGRLPQEVGRLRDEGGLANAQDAIIGQDQAALQNLGGFRDEERGRRPLTPEEQELKIKEQELARVKTAGGGLPGLGQTGRPDLRTREGVAEYAAMLAKDGKDDRTIDFLIKKLSEDGDFDPVGSRQAFFDQGGQRLTAPGFDRSPKGDQHVGRRVRGPNGEMRFKMTPREKALAAGQEVEPLGYTSDGRPIYAPQRSDDDATNYKRGAANVYRQDVGQRGPAPAGLSEREAREWALGDPKRVNFEDSPRAQRVEAARGSRLVGGPQDPATLLIDMVETGELSLDSVIDIDDNFSGKKSVRVGDLLQSIQTRGGNRFNSDGSPDLAFGDARQVQLERGAASQVREDADRRANMEYNDAELQAMARRAAQGNPVEAVSSPNALAGQQPIRGRFGQSLASSSAPENMGQRLIALQQMQNAGETLPGIAQGFDFNTSEGRRGFVQAVEIEESSKKTKRLNSGPATPDRGTRAITDQRLLRQAAAIDEMAAEAGRLAQGNAGDQFRATRLQRQADNAAKAFLSNIELDLDATPQRGATADNPFLTSYRGGLQGMGLPVDNRGQVLEVERPYDTTGERQALLESFQIPGGQNFEPSQMGLSRDEFAALSPQEQRVVLEGRDVGSAFRPMNSTPTVENINPRYNTWSGFGNEKLRMDQVTEARPVYSYGGGGMQSAGFGDGAGNLYGDNQQIQIQGPGGLGRNERSAFRWVAENVDGPFGGDVSLSSLGDWDGLPESAIPKARQVDIGASLATLNQAFGSRGVALPEGGIRNVQDFANAVDQLSALKADPRGYKAPMDIDGVMRFIKMTPGKGTTLDVANALEQLTLAEGNSGNEAFKQSFLRGTEQGGSFVRGPGQRPEDVRLTEVQVASNPASGAKSYTHRSGAGAMLESFDSSRDDRGNLLLARVGQASVPLSPSEKINVEAAERQLKKDAKAGKWTPAQVKEARNRRGMQPKQIAARFSALDPVARINGAMEAAIAENPEFEADIRASARIQMDEALEDPWVISQMRDQVGGKLQGERLGRNDAGMKIRQDPSQIGPASTSVLGNLRQAVPGMNWSPDASDAPLTGINVSDRANDAELERLAGRAPKRTPDTYEVPQTTTKPNYADRASSPKRTGGFKVGVDSPIDNKRAFAPAPRISTAAPAPAALPGVNLGNTPAQGVARSPRSVQKATDVIAKEAATRASNVAEARVDAPTPTAPAAAANEAVNKASESRKKKVSSALKRDIAARASQGRTTRNRRLGIGALAAAGTAGIAGMISGEREKREEEAYASVR